MNAWLSEIWRAWRASLRKAGFLLLATGVLALGIGASVAVFTLIDQVLLQPLSVPQASRLMVAGRLRMGQIGTISPQQYQHLLALEGAASIGLEQTGSVANIAGAGMPEQVPQIYADQHLLPTLGLRAVLGRNFSAAEDRPNGPKAVMLAYGFWQRRYGGDPQIIGRDMQVDGAAHTIVGVLPPGFNAVLGAGDVVVPMALPAISTDDGGNYRAIARLTPGVDAATFRAYVDTRLSTMDKALNTGGAGTPRNRYGAESLASWRHRDARPLLILFLGCAFVVLSIALVNLTNLMLLRTLSRNHDAAVRSALGAPIARLVLPGLGEGLLVGVMGALFGMALASSGLTLMQGFVPAEWLSMGRIHMRGLAWALGVATGMIGALLAAALGLWRSRTASTIDELREGGRSGMGVHSGRLGRVLVVAQVALATMLLCACGVFIHTLYDASQVRLGFASDNVLTFELAPSKTDFPDAQSVQNLSQNLVERLRTIAGVTDAAVSTNLPSSNDMFGQLNTDVHAPGGSSVNVQYRGVDKNYFKVFSIPVIEGLAFSRSDSRGAEPVAVVSQDLADSMYGGHAIGKMIQVQGSGDTLYPARIVGVVGETREFGPLQAVQPVLYVPLAQMPVPLLAMFRSFEPLRFALRGHGNPIAWRAGVREAVAETAPTQPIAAVRSMRSIVNATTVEARLNLLLIGVFASLALLLAVAGMYAVMAVAVAAREREFGVRTALGAPPSRLTRMVLRGGLIQIAIGLVIGIGLAFAVSKLLVHGSMALSMSLIGRLGAFDPAVVIGVCVLLALSGLLACLIPAVRAGRVQPMRALRGE